MFSFFDYFAFINNYNLNTDKALKIKIQDKEYEINDPNLIQTLISLIFFIK